MNLVALFSKLGLPVSATQNVTLFLVILLASFIFGILLGRYRLITVLINIYISFALLQVVPKGYLSDYSSELLFFFISLIALTFFGKRFFDIYISGSGSGFLWRIFVGSFLEVGMLLSIILTILPKKEALKYVSAEVLGYMASPEALFLWMIAPLIFIFIIHKKLNH